MAWNASAFDWTGTIDAVENRKRQNAIDQIEIPTKRLYNRVLQEQYKNAMGTYQNLGQDAAYRQWIADQQMTAPQTPDQVTGAPVTVPTGNALLNIPAGVSPAMPPGNNALAQVTAPPVQQNMPPLASVNSNAMMGNYLATGNVAGVNPTAAAPPTATPGPPPATTTAPPPAPPLPAPQPMAEQPSPKQAGNMLMTMEGPINPETIPPQFRQAAARSALQYNALARAEIQKATQEEFAATMPEVFKLVFNTAPGDMEKFEKMKGYIASNPRLLDMYKKSGLWQYILTAEVKPGSVNVVPHYLSQDDIDKLPPDVKNPTMAPGWYDVTSERPDPNKPPQVTGAKWKTMDEALATTIASAGGRDAEQAQRWIDIHQGMKTKEPTNLDQDEVYLRTKQIMSDPKFKGTKDDARFQAIKQVRQEKLDEAKQKVQFSVNVREASRKASEGGEAEAFKNWDKETKKEWFEMYKLDKTALPPFGWRDVASRRAFAKEFASYMKDGKLTGSDVVAGRAEMKADTASLQMQTKNKDMMVSFVNNIEKQTKRFEEIGKEVSRYDTRILNMPLRKARMAIKGTPNENKLSMYITEISNESARLSSSNAQSIAQLTDASQKKWQDIHDENLSIKDMINLLHETNRAGKMRVQSTIEQLEATKKRMRQSGGEDTAMYASNPKTGHRIKSTDGGKTWVDAETGKPL